MAAHGGQAGAARRSDRATAAAAALAALALCGLSACQTRMPPPASAWPERRAALQAVAQFTFAGRMAAATASEGFSASVNWQQQGLNSDLTLRSPLGFGGAHLQFDGTTLQMTASDGTLLDGAAAHAELVRVFGFEPPLASLRYWLLGVPDPAAEASETLDATQRLQNLQQLDWQIAYGDYVPEAGFWLPQRVSLQRGALRLKLIVTRWQLAPGRRS